MLSSTVLPIILEWSSLLEPLDYVVKYSGIEHFDTHRIMSIKIPLQRRKILRDNGIKNCFLDNTKIYDHCTLCLKTIPEQKCHRFRVVKGLSCHIVSSEHKFFESVDNILHTLREAERRSIFHQLKMMGDRI